MASPAPSTLETRRAQMFPTLARGDIDDLRRFGEIRSYAPGEFLYRAGEPSPGLIVILEGEAVVTRHGEFVSHEPIVTLAPGAFAGELGSLSARPALVDAKATTEVQALVISSSRLVDLMVQEAELGELIMRAFILRRVGLIESGDIGPVIVGRAGDPDALRLQGFLRSNGQPHQFLDSEKDAQAKDLIERLHIASEHLPIVLCPNGQLLRNPSESELARCLGVVRPIDPQTLYDVAIVGAGPAGLAAAVYAASEGLSVLVLEKRAFGGQAGASARIENYLGFPTGISGFALMGRAFSQAEKFGAEMAIPDDVVALNDRPGGDGFELTLMNGERANTRSVVIATGAKYRHIDCSELARYENASVHYWASQIEARLCAGQEVVLIGGGNSAGQAAVFLAGKVKTLWLLVRGKSLEETMSHYLIERLRALPNIEILCETEIVGVNGDEGALKTVRWRNHSSGAEMERPICHVFLFIGADPNTAWLANSGIALDEKGFVRTEGGRPLETTRSGVFAIGDVRSGSVKRVSSAVGEGAQVVATLHAYLADMQATWPYRPARTA